MRHSDRIDYGIDLGTTNSAIARMERDSPVVIKNELKHDTTPSAVAWVGKRNRLLVGSQAYARIRKEKCDALRGGTAQRSFIEFKRTMGTDHDYTDGATGQSRSSEELSAQVLEKLRRLVTDEDVQAAVITIPAAFTVRQQQATKRAAELAGFRECHLLQEPVAAAMAYGLEAKANTGKWVIFDFGGGTFDAALVLVQDGQISVVDTEGDNHLGGKDLDKAVMEKIVLPNAVKESSLEDYVREPNRKQALCKALMRWAEELNIQLSFQESHDVEPEFGELKLADGRDVDFYCEVMREDLRPIVAPIFQRAIDKTKALLKRNGLCGSDLDNVVLVGGPTYSPILRQMVREQICDPDTSVDPMTVVAMGAALYAGTVVRPPVGKDGDHGRLPMIELDMKYESTSISMDEFVTAKFADEADRERFGSLWIELRGQAWTSGKIRLDVNGVIFEEVPLESGKPNAFDVDVTTPRGDKIATNPSSITIIQGTKLTGAPLPNSLGVEVLDKDGKTRVFEPLKGAEKAKRLPVTGVSEHLSTTAELRPGMETDRLLIHLYENQSEPKHGRTRAILCDPLVAYSLSGLQVNRSIPRGTEFQVTVRTGPASSMPEEVIVDFPTLEEEYMLESSGANGGPESTDRATIDEWMNLVKYETDAAEEHIAWFRGESRVDEQQLGDLEARLGETREKLDEAYDQYCSAGHPDRDAFEQARSRMKEVLRELFELVAEHEGSRIVDELEEVWTELKRESIKRGMDPSRSELQETKAKVEQAKAAAKRGDFDVAKRVVDDVRKQIFQLVRCDWARDFVHYSKVQFYSISWTNAVQARHEVDNGIRALQNDCDCDELFRHAVQIFHLVIRDDTGPPIPPIPER